MKCDHSMVNVNNDGKEQCRFCGYIYDDEITTIKANHSAVLCQGFIEALDEINMNGKVSMKLMTNLKKELSEMLLELK